MGRGRFTFWLDYSKDEELLIAETIDELKSKRTFSKTIRDGIRLICDLRAGRLDVLFELFPWVEGEVKKRYATTDTEQLARLEKLLLQMQQTDKALMPGQGTARSGPKQLTQTANTAPPKPDEDDLDLLEIKKDTKSNSTQNFINSLMALQQ